MANTIYTTEELVQIVSNHALEHYEEDGWDFIVECWTDDEIAEELGKIRTAPAAIAKFRRQAKLQGGYRDEAKAFFRSQR